MDLDLVALGPEREVSSLSPSLVVLVWLKFSQISHFFSPESFTVALWCLLLDLEY